MGGNLHDHGVHAFVDHRTQVALQIDGVGRGVVGGDALLADHVAGGTDQAHLHARRLQDGLDHVGGGGLALGAGHADKAHLVRRMAVERRRHAGHRSTDAGHLHLGDVHVHKVIHHQRHAAVGDRLWRVVVGVKARTGDAEEQAVLNLLTAVGAQRFDLGDHITPGFHQVRNLFKQGAELHGDSPIHVICI